MNSVIDSGNAVVDAFHLMRNESMQALWKDEEGMPDELTEISIRWDRAYAVFERFSYSELTFPNSLTHEQTAEAEVAVKTLTGISAEYKAAYNFLSGGVR